MAHRQNPVARAILRVGGMGQTSYLLRVSPQAISKWRSSGRMPTDTPRARERVRLLAAASGVSVLALVGIRQPKVKPRRPLAAESDRLRA